MKIQLISHACVIVETVDCKILMDPWVFSQVFNDSWTLFPEPKFEESMLADVDFMWISHEHPDHFNIPTLRMLPENFRKHVTVLFQRNNSQKMFEAFRRFGYSQHQALPHREIFRLTERTEIYCYQVGQMDSCLGVRDTSGILLNVNDAYTNVLDANRIRDDFGSPDILLNQFSIAGYGGFEDFAVHLTEMAKGHIEHMLETHKEVGAKVTIPFASYVLFSCEDNQYINEFANTPRSVAERFQDADADIAVLYLGDIYDTNSAKRWDSEPAILRYEEERKRLAEFEFDTPKPTPIETIKEAFGSICADLAERYPSLILRLLKPVTVEIPDLETTIRFSIADGNFVEVAKSEQADMIVNSQPLWFAFSAPFGVQTLGVSGRFRLCNKGDSNNWARHRALFGLYNAEFYLRPKYFFTASNLGFLWARRRGLIGQLATRIA